MNASPNAGTEDVNGLRRCSVVNGDLVESGSCHNARSLRNRYLRTGDSFQPKPRDDDYEKYQEVARKIGEGGTSSLKMPQLTAYTLFNPGAYPKIGVQFRLT